MFFRALSYHSLFSYYLSMIFSKTNFPVHSYADDCTLDYSTSFPKTQVPQQDLRNSRIETAERLTSDLSIISYWSKRNLVSFTSSKFLLLHLLSRHNFPEIYPRFFESRQLSPFSTLNILGLPLTQNFRCKPYLFFCLDQRP